MLNGPSALRTMLATVMVLIAFQPAKAAQRYDSIVVFGDSYDDVGNIYLATKGAIPLSPPYYQGRFSNGPVWVEHFAQSFGLPMQPYLAGGTDYAFGGAELLQDLVTPEGTVPSVFSQVGLYLAAHGGKADPKALYVIEGGGNDILDATSGSPAQLGEEIACKLAEIEAILRLAGAKHFVIPNLFDVGFLPAGRANYDFDTEAVKTANRRLAELLAIESCLEEIRIYQPDIYALAHAIAVDKTHMGFTNIETPCLNIATGSVCADPAHAAFWDTEHPTEFGHSFLAITVEALVHP